MMSVDLSRDEQYKGLSLMNKCYKIWLRPGHPYYMMNLISLWSGHLVLLIAHLTLKVDD